MKPRSEMGVSDSQPTPCFLWLSCAGVFVQFWKSERAWGKIHLISQLAEVEREVPTVAMFS